MKKIVCVLLSILICCSFASCKKEKQEEETLWIMDTLVTLRLYGCADSASVFADCRALLEEIDAALSRTDPASDVSHINADGTAGDLSPHTAAVLAAALEISELTAGAYLPTMGALSDLWRLAGERNELPDEGELSAALAAARQGFTFENGVCALSASGASLDLGGIGKGYAMDALAALLSKAELRGALVSFGSNVTVIGEKGDGTDFRVSLRDPKNAGSTVGDFVPFRGSLSVSGDYERYVTVNGVRYHHILDPLTGYPASAGLSSVAVIASDGARADALSTAFLVMGKEKALALIESGKIDAEAVFIATDGTVSRSAGAESVFRPR